MNQTEYTLNNFHYINIIMQFITFFKSRELVSKYLERFLIIKKLLFLTLTNKRLIIK